jgi:hypothetical protein
LPAAAAHHHRCAQCAAGLRFDIVAPQLTAWTRQYTINQESLASLKDVEALLKAFAAGALLDAHSTGPGRERDNDSFALTKYQDQVSAIESRVR